MLADVVRSAREPREIEAALVRLACQMAGAQHAELVLEPGSPAQGAAPPHCSRRVIACWPKTTAAAAGENAGDPASSAFTTVACDGSPTALTIPIGAFWGEPDRIFLRLIPAPGQPWSLRLIQQLTTLCTFAAAARASLRGDRSALAQPLVLAAPAHPRRRCHGPALLGPLRDELFLTAFLPYAVAQARRNRGPLSLLCISIDRYSAIRSLLGSELAEAAMQRVAETIVKLLRASDVVAQIGDGQIIASLAFAQKSDALAVAETLRQAIAGMGSTSPGLPVLTASIGVATYPEDAADTSDLITEAVAAMNRDSSPSQSQSSSTPGAGTGTSAQARRRAGRRES